MSSSDFVAGRGRHPLATLHVSPLRRYGMKTTAYFDAIRQRPDRKVIKDEWIERVIESPVHEAVQADGRIRRWAPIPEMDNRHLRVILLPDGETVHNAFFDRWFLS